jgi:hypothetical protein
LQRRSSGQSREPASSAASEQRASSSAASEQRASVCGCGLRAAAALAAEAAPPAAAPAAATVAKAQPPPPPPPPQQQPSTEQHQHHHHHHQHHHHCSRGSCASAARPAVGRRLRGPARPAGRRTLRAGARRPDGQRCAPAGRGGRTANAARRPGGRRRARAAARGRAPRRRRRARAAAPARRLGRGVGRSRSGRGEQQPRGEQRTRAASRRAANAASSAPARVSRDIVSAGQLGPSRARAGRARPGQTSQPARARPGGGAGQARPGGGEQHGDCTERWRRRRLRHRLSGGGATVSTEAMWPSWLSCGHLSCALPSARVSSPAWLARSGCATVSTEAQVAQLAGVRAPRLPPCPLRLSPPWLALRGACGSMLAGRAANRHVMYELAAELAFSTLLARLLQNQSKQGVANPMCAPRGWGGRRLARPGRRGGWRGRVGAAAGTAGSARQLARPGRRGGWRGQFGAAAGAAGSARHLARPGRRGGRRCTRRQTRSLGASMHSLCAALSQK